MSDAPVLLRGGRVVDPSRRLDQTLDLLLRDGVVAKVDEKIAPPKGAEVVEAAGLVVAPGFVDLHVHLREPGFEYKETIATGTAAAAAGGFTTVCAMATDPVADDAPTVAFVVRRARETGRVRVFPIGAISKGLAGEQLAEIGSMKAEGIVAVSDDGKGVQNAGLMRRAMEYASMFDLPVVVHAEDAGLAMGGVMNEGWVSTRLGLAGQPAAAEAVMVARDVQIAGLTGSRLHVAHVSTRESLDAIRNGRRHGVDVTCEATPHHLTLTDEEVARSGYDTRFKMNPPLRSEADRQALVAALADGTIDCVATDHAPHHADEKALEFADAPFGVIGLETALPVLVDALLVPRHVSLMRLVEVLSTAPARLFGLPYGTLAEGAPGDVVLFSTTRSTHVTPDGFQSKARNSPWVARTLKGRVERTWVAGREVWGRASGGVTR
ncbi:MAG TPA: dihydroorotase [Thermoanaerobaculia bacterium]|nr:dihydroorotase [Thermoanaerobaculia bacterium]